MQLLRFTPFFLALGTFGLSGCFNAQLDQQQGNGLLEVNLNPGVPSDTLVLTSPPASAVAGSAFSQDLGITITGTDGNLDRNFDGNILNLSAFSDSSCKTPAGGGFLTGSTAQLSAGSAIFTGVSYNHSGTIYLQASGPNLPRSNCTSPITIQAGALAGFDLSFTAGASLTAGASATMAVRATDAYSNTVSTYTGTAHFATNDLAGVVPTDQTYAIADAGVRTLSATLFTAGVRTVSVQDLANPSFQGGEPVSVGPSAAASLVLGSLPVSFNAGSPQNLTVTVEDAFNNVVSNYAGTVSFSSNNAQAILPASYTFTKVDLGTHTFTGIFLNQAGGGNNVTVTAPGGLSAFVGAIVVSPGPAVNLVFGSLAGILFQVGVCSPAITLTAQDAYGNGSGTGIPAVSPALSIVSGSGTFYSDSSCSTSITATTIAAGASAAAPFYFKPGAPALAAVILVGPGGLGPLSQATQSINVLNRAQVTAGAIAAGNDHTCVIALNNDIQCWGLNDKGQIGDPSTVTSTGYNFAPYTIPVNTWGGLVPIQLSAGAHHTCALLSNNTVKCWGDNSMGQLGNSTTVNSTSPVAIAGAAVVNFISAGLGNGCLITTGSALQCWGDNAFGEVGDGTLTNRLSPITPVGGAGPVSWVSNGAYHGCGVYSGAVKCWGDNTYGELGDGTVTSSNVPVNVVSLSGGVTMAVAGSAFSCAMDSSGVVSCWGNNKYGQLATATNAGSVAPNSNKINTGISGATAVYVSSGEPNATTSPQNGHACAIVGGVLKCWGDNLDGQIGTSTNLGSVTPNISPTSVPLAGPVTAAALGQTHTCAIIANGRVTCWGNNSTGQMGLGAVDSGDFSPQYVKGF